MFKYLSVSTSPGGMSGMAAAGSDARAEGGRDEEVEEGGERGSESERGSGSGRWAEGERKLG